MLYLGRFLQFKNVLSQYEKTFSFIKTIFLYSQKHILKKFPNGTPFGF